MIASWRALTGGEAVRDRARRTLLACSAGADSSALALCLAAAGKHGVIAHVVHDMRPPEQTGPDRDHAAALAGFVSLPFVDAHASARGGNAEGQARRSRYEALERLARENGCPFVAVAHHADDQLETVLMRLCRGAGVRGMAGMSPVRPLGTMGVRLVRPMLVTTRDEAERICRLAGWEWREDATNRDVSRLRAAIRQRVTPILRGLAPGVAQRSVGMGEGLALAVAMIDERVRPLAMLALRTPGAAEWPRAILADEPGAVLAEFLRREIGSCTGGRGLDRLGRRSLAGILRAIGDRATDPRTFSFAGVQVIVTAHAVRIAPRQH